MRFIRLQDFTIVLLFAMSAGGAAQLSTGHAGAQKAIAAQAPARKTSPPYTGDLSRFEDKDRAQKLQVQRVMDILGIKPGVSVADIGAGSGWFTVRAARRTGNSKVYAVDICWAATRDRDRCPELSRYCEILRAERARGCAEEIPD